MAQPVPNAVAQAILQVIYAVFLGALLTAIVVVGITTFAPVQDEAVVAQIEDRNREIEDLYTCKDPTGGCELTPQEEARAVELQRQLDDLYSEQERIRQEWNRSAGLVAVGIATVLLALSLVRWDRAIVLSNGLLLGGLFTMVYGLGLTLAGGEDAFRFVVLVVALVLVVGLGYLRFARLGPPAPQPPTSGSSGELDGRVAALEARIEDLRRALG